MWEFSVSIAPFKALLSFWNKVCNRNECKIKFAPELHTISPVMNGGKLQGDSANIQIRFGTDTDLELIDAVFSFHKDGIRCNERNSKLSGGKNWNSFLFNASKLPYTPEENLKLKVRVCNHTGDCCELSQELQMKQFSHPDFSGKKSGRWEMHPKGIFSIASARKRKFKEI